MALVLTHGPDGQVGLMSADPIALAAQIGGDSGGSGNSSADPAGAGGDQTKPSCKEGGDATVAADGLLDMSFCLDSTVSRRR
jgi:hypothetical protein